MEKKFGFYPYQKTFIVADIEIKPLDDFGDHVGHVLSQDRIYDGWYYPPVIRHIQPRNSLLAPLKPSTVPEIPTDIFWLPPTHILRHDHAASAEHADFLVVCLGLLVGLRLMPEPWGHFYRTPVDEHKLADLVVTRADVERCLPLFNSFYLSASLELRSWSWSAINTFQLARCYNHQFEEFFYHYVTLDTVFRILRDTGRIGGRRIKHGERPKAICDHVGIPIPDWAVTDPSGNCHLSRTLSFRPNRGRPTWLWRH